MTYRYSPKTPVTKRQLEAFGYICECIDTQGSAPTRQAIADFLGISKPSAHGLVRALEIKGFISVVPFDRRAISIVPRLNANEDPPPACNTD